MPLATHINVDSLEKEIVSKNKQLVKKYVGVKNRYNKDKKHTLHLQNLDNSNTNLATYKITDIDFELKYKIPPKGANADYCYQSIHDELTLDGNPTLNLASFVNTFVGDDTILKLIQENITKNLADNDEYPILMDIHQRCISILADLWHAPATGADSSKTGAIGTACTGSSEAVMLGGLAMKKLWQQKRQAAGKDYYHPNIIMASCCQVALEKFARYFDVEARILPVDPKENYLIDYNAIKENCDENTIGVFVIVGSTYTGGFEKVDKVSQILDEVEREKGWDIPIHVDGASGAMIAPFIYPDLQWDFRNKRVHSINTSGHKFGLVTAGLGWVIWKEHKLLPEALKFQLRYLGGLEESFNLNFSRPGYQVIHQYYNFLNLGFSGYKQIFDSCITNARLLSMFLEESGYFKCVSNIHIPKNVSSRENLSLSDHANYHEALPVVSFQFSEEFRKEYPEIPQSIVATLLRNRGFILPNYPLPHHIGSDSPNKNNEILRIVVRYSLTLQLLDKLMSDIVQVTEILISSAKAVRESIQVVKKTQVFENDQEEKNVIYNMLLSIASDGNNELLEFKKLSISDKKDNDNIKNENKNNTHHTQGTHKKHIFQSFRGTC
ncbi:hypothetical protein PACTADRAFT_49529 [Pachysolen tannophilus NRRL Y-2460]|uniref:Glutamate decarboxylase n=1 Tax=Pachysolen tannophilus NRRL Y-2460 TaxID=669874 RepID=A0A1E4TWJ0_PACTA|nr:hypothetical protein PACTADRAFT_49529 [Pachysolen tannophilus NRRL Y-2460]